MHYAASVKEGSEQAFALFPKPPFVERFLPVGLLGIGAAPIREVEHYPKGALTPCVVSGINTIGSARPLLA